MSTYPRDSVCTYQVNSNIRHKALIVVDKMSRHFEHSSPSFGFNVSVVPVPLASPESRIFLTHTNCTLGKREGESSELRAEKIYNIIP
jgi:hypothetical protein